MSTQTKELNNAQNVERASSRKTFLPDVDIYETPGSIVLIADMPGVDEKSVDITLEKNVLTIEGRVPEEETVQPVYAEFESGDYRRAFTLHEEIAQDKIEANVKNGLLTLVLPKVKPTRRKIEVKSA